MPTPEFIRELRARIGTHPLWLTGVTAVVLRGSGDDEQVLLCRRADNGAVTPITGIVDPGEEPAAAAVREVLEEADITVTADALVWVHALPPMTYANGDRAQYLDLVFRCTYLRGAANPADGENTEVFWCRLDALDDQADLSDDMRERIRAAAAPPAAARFER